jgi:hypothetical protein
MKNATPIYVKDFGKVILGAGYGGVSAPSKNQPIRK